MSAAFLKNRAHLISRDLKPYGYPTPKVYANVNGVYQLVEPKRPTATPSDYSITALKAAGIPIKPVVAPFGANLDDIDFNSVADKLEGEILNNEPQN